MGGTNRAMRVRRLRNNWLSSLQTMAKMRSLILVTYASFCLILRSASQNTMAEKPTRNSTSTHNTRRPTPASVSSYAPPARTRWRKSPPETALHPTTRAGPRQLLSHPPLRQPEHDGGKAHQKQHFNPQHAQAHAFQEDGPDDGDEITRRHHVREDLDGYGHVLNRVKEARQHERGQERGDEPQLEGKQLGAGQRRNQDAPEEGSRKKDHGGQGQPPGAAAERHAVHENSHQHRNGRIRQADHKKSEHLAHYDFRGAHGSGKQLLHGAHLPLAGYRERSQQRGNDHHHGGDQARHDVVRGFQGAVVPDAHARIHGGIQRYTGAAVYRSRFF